MNVQKNQLACIEINPKTAPTHSIIWLHGLGADGHDFAPMVPELKLPSALSVRFVFPHAPLRPVTINNGYVMRAWYDIVSMNMDQRVDKLGMDESVLNLRQLINNELDLGIPLNKIILAGFSQGSVIALMTGLGLEHALGGILFLSGYFPFAQETLSQMNPEVLKTPIFIAHGTEDTVVPYQAGLGSMDLLKRAGFDVTWHSYKMGHSVCPQEIQDISVWMQKVLR